MKRNIALLYILFLCINLNAQQKKDSMVFTKIYYPSGKVSSEGYIRNNKPDGYWKTYSESGVLISEGNRKNYELDSLWKFYNDSSKLFMMINYLNGKKNGIKTTFNEIGKVQENFKDDIKEGLTVYYYGDSTIRKIIKYENGKENGLSKEFSKEGIVISLVDYKYGFVISREYINRINGNGRKQGVWKTFYPNDNLKTEESYKNGLKDGFFKIFDIDGNLISIKKYIDDELQEDDPEVVKLDIKIDYYESGNIKTIGSYKNNIPEGVRRDYKQDGTIESAKIFRNGSIIGDGIVDEKGFKQGNWKEYYETGELKAEGNYKNNEKTGLWKWYYVNGKLDQIGSFGQGEMPEGDWKWYYENGRILMEEGFSAGKPEGTYKEYNDSGIVIVKGQYQDGLEEGTWTYYINGTTQEGKYKEGMKDGLWKFYYPNGKLYSEGKYYQDSPDGKHVFYYENGTVKEEGNFEVGKKQGDWKYFNDDGELFLTITYNYDKEIKFDNVKIKPELIEN
jgi:uncharacterized protein